MSCTNEMTPSDLKTVTRRSALQGVSALGAAALAGPVLVASSGTVNAQSVLGRALNMEEFLEVGELPDMSTGAKDAPVTMVEYASMTCPHCARFHNNVLGPIKEKYIDTGKVRLILREFPLDNLATAAAMLTRCVGPEKHYAFTNALFLQQQTWAFSGGNPVEPLREISKLAGFTRDSFDACLKNQKLVD